MKITRRNKELNKTRRKDADFTFRSGWEQNEILEPVLVTNDKKTTFIYMDLSNDMPASF